MSDFCSDLDWCIDNRRPNAFCIPWVNRSSADSLAAVEAALLAQGWVYNDLLFRFERGGWYLWLRSQGELAAPIAQFNRIAPWGDEVDGWGLDDSLDDSPACPDCGDYTENGLPCLGCRAAQKVRTQLSLFGGR
jgi:hypothetical protein